jgi:hypothetical protein
MSARKEAGKSPRRELLAQSAKLLASSTLAAAIPSVHAAEDNTIRLSKRRGQAGRPRPFFRGDFRCIRKQAVVVHPVPGVAGAGV